MAEREGCPLTMRGVNTEYLEQRGIPDFSKILPDVANKVMEGDISMTEGLDFLESSLANQIGRTPRFMVMNHNLKRSLYFLLFSYSVMRDLEPFCLSPEVWDQVKTGTKGKQIYGTRDRLGSIFKKQFLPPAIAKSLATNEVLGDYFLESERMAVDSIGSSDLDEFKRIAYSGFLDSVNATASVFLDLDRKETITDEDQKCAWQRIKREIYLRMHVHEDVEDVMQEDPHFARKKKHCDSVVHDNAADLALLRTRMRNSNDPYAERSVYKVCAAFHLGGYESIEEKLLKPLFSIFCESRAVALECAA